MDGTAHELRLGVVEDGLEVGVEGDGDVPLEDDAFVPVVRYSMPSSETWRSTRRLLSFAATVASRIAQSSYAEEVAECAEVTDCAARGSAFLEGRDRCLTAQRRVVVSLVSWISAPERRGDRRFCVGSGNATGSSRGISKGVPDIVDSSGGRELHVCLTFCCRTTVEEPSPVEL